MFKMNVVKKVLLVLLLTMVPQQLMLFFTRNWSNPWTFVFVSFIAFCLCFVAIKIVGKPKNLTIKASHMSYFITRGWYLIIAGVILGVLNLLSIEGTYIPSKQEVIIFFTEIVFVVLFEETLFRGIIQNYIIEDFERKVVSPWRALCIASAIFGAVHILNLLGRPYFVLGTVTQVIYTFCVGIIIGTVYWSSKNIWICFLLHYIFNALGGYSDLFVEKTTEAVTASSTGTDIGFLSAAIQLIIMLPCIPIAWLIYKQAIKKH